MSEATLAILEANVVTLNSTQPRAEAVAIRNGKILAVGSTHEIRKYITSHTIVIDARGKTVIPGLVDCHVHMTGFGHSLQGLDLRDAQSIEEIQRRLREYAQEKTPGWILGGRWDQESCEEKRLPTRWDLDASVADKPVFLTRVCGHIGVANSKALHFAHITKETRVEGGAIDLDNVSGEPNGILRENAMELVWKVAPKHRLGDLEEACSLASKKAVEAGLTCVHWLVDSPEEIRVLQKLHSAGKLPLRVYLGVSVNLLNALTDLGLVTGFGSDMLKVGFVKILADGSLGGHTAAMKEPYSDKPEAKGMMLYSEKKLDELISKAHNAGLQVAVHAIGDYAIETVLKIYKRALEKSPCENHRHRIEHCSVLNPSLIRRLKRSHVVACVQPHFIVSDFWVTNRVGKTRARWVYALKTLMHEGVEMASSSDCPVEPISPLLGIWAATTKNSVKEKLTVEEALKAYTVNAAYSSFDEKRKGTIEPGKLADLTVLSDNPIDIPSENIKDISIEMTIVDGKVVYDRTVTEF